MKRRKTFFIIFLLSTLLSFFPITKGKTAGAVLFLSPNSGTYTIGKSISVKVMVDSGGGIGINAAEAVITYDPAYLVVTSISKSGSIFNLWTTNNGEGPGYSNTSGKINFGGGSSNAYKGNAGTIFTVSFTPKKAGKTDIVFSSGMVLAADGKGTNIFSGFGNASYIIQAAAEPAKKETIETKKEETTTKGLVPPLPEVSSPTHPDENIWYANNNPEFTWKILSDLTNVSFLITTEPTTDPGASNRGVVESERFEQVKDGIFYFHIKYQNKSGWGPVAHKKFMVDATPPNLSALFVDNGGDSTNPSPKIKFTASDYASGIDFYIIKIGSDSVKLNPDKLANGYYEPSPLPPGEHEAVVAVYDKAQNSASSSVIFTIDSLKPPIITNIPKTINKKSELVIQGESFYNQVTVKIYIAKSDKEIIEGAAKTDDNGNWSYIHKSGLEVGNYEVWAKIIDRRGAQSLNSSKHLLTVVSPSLIDAYGWLIILILLLIIIFLILYIIYLQREFKEEKTRIKEETEEVKIKLRKIFAALREETDELIELADKKPGLSETEKRIKEKIQESLDIAEEFLTKEVDDVEKEIKLSNKETSKK